MPLPPAISGRGGATNRAARAARGRARSSQDRVLRTDVAGPAGTSAERPPCAGARVRGESRAQPGHHLGPGRAACRRCQVTPAVRLGVGERGSEREHLFACLRRVCRERLTGPRARGPNQKDSQGSPCGAFSRDATAIEASRSKRQCQLPRHRNANAGGRKRARRLRRKSRGGLSAAA